MLRWSGFPVVFVFPEVKLIFHMTIIRETKTTAIMEPATLLSVELSAFQSHIEKRISTTKSITARSEYGVDILAGSILLPLNLIFVNRLHLGARKEGRQNLLITLALAVWTVLCRGKMFRGAEMSWAKFSSRPYLCRILFFMKQVWLVGGFLLRFCGVFSGFRNVLPITFSRSKAETRERLVKCGGRIYVRRSESEVVGVCFVFFQCV